MSGPTAPTYKTTNWPTYNDALKRRGALTIWFDPEMRWDAGPTSKRGRQPTYSDAAVQTCLTMPSRANGALRGKNASAARSGETGADTTAGAVPRPRCTV